MQPAQRTDRTKGNAPAAVTGEALAKQNIHLIRSFGVNATSTAAKNQSRPVGRYWSANELHAIKADASPVSLTDGINERLVQASAVVAAIRADGVSDNDGFMMSHTVVCDMLWAVDAMMEQAQDMTRTLGTSVLQGA